MKILKVLFLSGFVFIALNSQAEVAAAGSQSIEIQASAQAVQPLETNFYSYNFGFVWVNSRRVVRYDVTNTGSIPLGFARATISGPDYDAYHTCGSGLNVGERCYFEIHFLPRWEGPSSGRFVLSFSPDANLVVDVYGHGQR